MGKLSPHVAREPSARFLRPEARFADRAAVGLRRLRRGVHARRGLLESRRRRHRAEGHDARAAARQPAAPRVRDADGHAQRDRPAESRRRPRRRRSILPTLDFTETRFIANVCGSTIEEYAEVTRRFDDSPIDAIGDQHLLPEHQGRRRAVRQLSARCRARVDRGVPRGDEEAADREALAEPDRHPRRTRAPASRPARTRSP